MTDQTFEDLRLALTWGATLDLTEEQRKSLAALCSKICGEGFVPSWRVKQEADRRRAAEEPLKALETRVEALEAALKANREEWVFRRKSATR
jgi:hypothetical protein